jgi:hypothetical protein
MSVFVYMCVLTRVRVALGGFLDWILDLLTSYTHDSELQVITVPPLISTIQETP